MFVMPVMEIHSLFNTLHLGAFSIPVGSIILGHPTFALTAKPILGRHLTYALTTKPIVGRHLTFALTTKPVVGRDTFGYVTLDWTGLIVLRWSV